mgnify:CR=1 FL=1
MAISHPSRTSPKASTIEATTIEATVVTADDLEIDSGTLSIDTTNNRIGIGTVTPASTLEIEGSSGDLTIEIDNNVSNSANLKITSGAGNARADFTVDGNNHLTMKGQRVGIVSNNPQKTLDVTGDGQFSTDLTVGGLVTAGTCLVNTDKADTGNATSIGLQVDLDQTGAMGSGNTGNNKGIEIAVNSDAPTMVGTVYNKGLEIDVTGGTSGEQTCIGADIVASGADANYGMLLTGTTADLILGVPGNTNNTVISAHGQSTGDSSNRGKHLIVKAGNSHADDNNLNGGNLILKTGDGDGTGTAAMMFHTKVSGSDAAAERMRIHTDGKVGIGTNAPGSDLHVRATAAEVRIGSDASSACTLNLQQNDATSTSIQVGTGGALNITNNVANADMVFKCKDAGVSREALRIDADVLEVIVNDGHDPAVDFRVEGDTNTHLLFVDSSDDSVIINGTTNHAASLVVDGSAAAIALKEMANAPADTGDFSQKDTGAGELYFTTDSGDDIQLTSGTSVAGGGSAANDVSAIIATQVFS